MKHVLFGIAVWLGYIATGVGIIHIMLWLARTEKQRNKNGDSEK